MEFITRHSESLEQVKQRLELVIESSGVGVWDWNPQTDEVVFDKQWAAMLGLRPDELSQTLADWSERVHPDDLQGCFDDIEAHIKGETAFYQNTHRMRHKEGHWVYILDRGTVVERDEHGLPIRFTGTHTDVTAYVESEQRAKEALQARELFFAQISHEIRTPVHAMLAAASLIDRRHMDQKNHRFFDVVQQCGGNLTRLMDDILDIARLSAGGIKPNIEAVDVPKIVQDVVDLFQPKAAMSKITLRAVSNVPRGVICRTDPARLTQILHNLVSNSLKYTPRGFVHLEVSVIAGNVVISVEDSGIGIADIEAAFGHFSRETLLNDKGSTGLGLGIVKQLCDLLGIHLTVESMLGQGTTFTLTLDSVEHTEVATNDHTLSNSDISSAEVTDCHGLMVDDSPFNLFVGEQMLAPFFQCIDTAESAVTALQCLASKHYDVVFIDLNMPGMNGLALAGHIRAVARSPAPLLICQTADAASKHEAMASGVFDGFLMKPYSQRDIRACLTRLTQMNRDVINKRPSRHDLIKTI